MIRWLCLQVTFLGDRYHGTRLDGREADWPPSPHRLLQALVAGAHLTARSLEWSERKAQAFMWLESLEPPEIVTPPKDGGAPLTLSVPNNDLDVIARAWAKGTAPPKEEAQLRTLKVLQPQGVFGHATVRFLWPISQDKWTAAQPHAELLCAEARHLHHFGLGLDLVAGDGRILDDAAKRGLDGDLWIPLEGKTTRTPRPGSLAEIMERHAAFLRRVQDHHLEPLGPPSRVRWVTYRRRAEGRRRADYAFEFVRPDGNFASFDAEKTAHVAAWLRHAAHETAKRLGMPQTFIEGYVCGHGAGTEEKARRLSYLPLPSVGHHHVDGRIRRALLVEPVEGPDPQTPPIIRRLSSWTLVDERGEPMAGLRSVAATPGGVLAAYRAMSPIWGSVTPVLLPGLDDRRSRKSVALIAKALAQAGYTTPVVEIAIQGEPVFPGADMAHRYFVPEHLRRWPRLHAIIRFAEPVRGPIALGAGRHSGLGTLAALQ